MKKIKLTKKKMLIIGLVCIVWLIIWAWRQSYFVFTPDLVKLDEIDYQEMDTTMRLLLKTEYEKIDEWEESLTEEERQELYFTDEKMANENTKANKRKEKEWVDSISNSFGKAPFLELERKDGFYKQDYVFTYKSTEHNWEKTFSDYYIDGGAFAYNKDYIVFFFRRGCRWKFANTIGVPVIFPGIDMNSPPLYIYLFFNTAKIGWGDLFIIDRKTGNVKEKYRMKNDCYSFDIDKVLLNSENVLYIRTGWKGSKVYIHQIK